MFRLLVIAAVFCATARSEEQRTIAVSEASELVNALLKPDGWTKLKGFVLYQALFDAEFQGFYFIHAEWDSPSRNPSSVSLTHCETNRLRNWHVFFMNR